MSSRERPYRVVAFDESAVELNVTRRGEARELLWQLLGSKAGAHRALAHRQLLRDGVALEPARLVEPGETLVLKLSPPAAARALASGPVEVVYQDAALLAADKPAGILVHGDGTGAQTLTERACGLLADQGSAAVPQAVQRLDVDTTGLVLFSLTAEFQPKLDAQVAGHDMRKRYLAVVEGQLRHASDDWLALDGPIARDRHDARRMRVGHTGKPALTRVKTVATGGGCSLLLVELGSGRRHQIRVHLAHEGHPVLGDALYGQQQRGALMLHAWQESLVHPVTDAPLVLRTPVPARFVRMFSQAEELLQAAVEQGA